MAEIKIMQGKGIHFTFENGVTASLQLGEYNYCNQLELDGLTAHAENCEVAAWDKNGNWITRQYKDNGDDVIGYVKPDEIPYFLQWCKNYLITIKED